MRSLPLLDVTATRRPGRDLPGYDPSQRRSLRQHEELLAQARASGARLEADPFNVLVLNYTMKCPLACDFCCYACNPGRTETMDLEFALDIVDQAAALGVFEQAGFTGGEPLLFTSEILTICERLREHAMGFSMISSCHWATDDATTATLVGRLVDLGMSVLSISHDPSHGKFVPLDNVRRAVRHARDRGCPVVVCASHYRAGDKLADVLPDLVDLPGVELVDRVVLPVGMSTRRRLTPQGYGLTQDIESFACYKRIFHDITVFWDGSVYPCCSVYNRSTSGLRIGNLYDEPLARVWDRVEGSLKYRLMKRQGFGAMYDLIAAVDPQVAALLPDPAESLGPCQLCHRIFSDRALTARIEEAFERHEREQIGAVLDLLDAQLRPEQAGALLAALS